MIYHIIKTITNPLSDEDFIKECEKDYKKNFWIAMACIVTCVFLLFSGSLESEHKILQLLTILSIFAGFFSAIYLFGNMASDGACSEHRRSKDINDYIIFAKRCLFLPKGMILAKYLEKNSLNPLETLLSSCEIRCENTNTKEIVAINLSNDKFAEQFRIIEKSELKKDEMILDLTQKELIAYIGRE